MRTKGTTNYTRSALWDACVTTWSKCSALKGRLRNNVEQEFHEKKETASCTIYHVLFTICDRLRHVPFTMYYLQFADAEKSFKHLLTIIPKFGVIYGL